VSVLSVEYLLVFEDVVQSLLNMCRIEVLILRNHLPSVGIRLRNGAVMTHLPQRGGEVPLLRLQLPCTIVLAADSRSLGKIIAYFLLRGLNFCDFVVFVHLAGKQKCAFKCKQLSETGITLLRGRAYTHQVRANLARSMDLQ